MNTINKNLLYASVIESDGRIGKQFTFLGSALILLFGSAIGAAILFFAIPSACAFLK